MTYAFASLEIVATHQILAGTDRTRRIMSLFWQTCCEYGRFYIEGIRSFWGHLRPATYSLVLLSVWLFGFLLMKSGAKR